MRIQHRHLEPQLIAGAHRVVRAVQPRVKAMVPMLRGGQPEEVANMVLYLASDEAAWVTGGTYTIDGGMTVW